MTRSHCRLIPVVVVLAAFLAATPAFSSPAPSWLPGGLSLESAWQPLTELWHSLTAWWPGTLGHAGPPSGGAHSPLRIQTGPGPDPYGQPQARPKNGAGADPYGQVQPDTGPGADPYG
jgi:hypothetical protein